MLLGSHHGSSTRKQLVRPFLSSPVTVFTYLLLILTCVGLLEWLLRASAHARLGSELGTRSAALDQYSSQVKLMTKLTVSDSRPTTRTARRFRRQTGEISDPDETPHDTPDDTPHSTPVEPPVTTTPIRISTTPIRISTTPIRISTTSIPIRTTPIRISTTPVRTPPTTPPFSPQPPPPTTPFSPQEPPPTTPLSPEPPPPTTPTTVPPPSTTPQTSSATPQILTTTPQIPTTAPLTLTTTPLVITTTPIQSTLTTAATPPSITTSLTASSIPTPLLIVVSSSTILVTPSQVTTSQTTPLAIPVVTSSVSSSLSSESKTASKDTITPVQLPPSSVDNLIESPTATATAECRRGFNCLFAHRNEPIPLPQGSKTLPGPVRAATEFAATFVPIIIVLFLQSFWLIIYASIRLNEPFHQLAQPQGAKLNTGILFEFLDTGVPFDHIKAAFNGKWTSFYMVVAYLVLVIVMVLPSVAAETFSVQNQSTYCAKGSGSGQCVQRVWTIAPGSVRALQVMLIVMAVLVFIVLVVRTYRGSALSLKKVNLALIAATLNDPQTVGLLRGINPDLPLNEAPLLVQNPVWALEPSIASEIGTEQAYYILRNRPEEIVPTETIHSEPIEHIPNGRGPPRSLLDLFLPGLIIILLFVILLIYITNEIEDSKLRVFFGSVSVGPKFFLVSMCTILGLAMYRVEHEVRVLTPYRSLQHTSEPQAVLMRRLHPSPLTQAFVAFRHSQWVSALLSFVTGYGVNILAMTISNVPYHPGRSISTTVACMFVSLVLLLMMTVALLTVPFWRRGNSRLTMTRLPITLADIYVLMVHARIPGVEVVEQLPQTIVYGKGIEHGEEGKKSGVVQSVVEVER